MALADFLKRDCMARACHPAELGDAGSVWKGRSHQFFSSHPPPPPPVTRATRTGIYYLGRRGLASGRHSEAATPAPPQKPTKTLGVSSCQPPLLHRALLQQSQHCACNPVSSKGGAGAGIFQLRGAGTLPFPDPFSWILQPGQGAWSPTRPQIVPCQGQNLQNRQTDSRCSR